MARKADKHISRGPGASKEELERLRAVFDLSGDAIFILDSEGCFLDVNRVACERYGYARDEMLRRHMGDLITPEHAPQYAGRMATVLRDGAVVFETEHQAKDGRSIPTEISARLIRGKGPDFIISICRDVTERVRAEEEQRQIFMSLVENSTDLIGIASLDGKVFYLNKAGLKLVGLDNLGKDRRRRIQDFALEKHFIPLQEMLASLSKEGTWKGEARIRDFRTGTPIPIEIHGFAIRDEKTGQPIALAAIVRDISERKKLEEEMARGDKLNSIGILAGGIAHDFNNLLTAIFGNITLAKMYANRKSEVYKRLEESGKAAERARDLTHQLLTFSKGGAPVKKTISLQELAKESANFVLRGSNVKCEFSFPADLWNVEADEGQISQVLNNLIINATHAMSEGGTVQLYCGNVIVDQSDLPLEKGKYILISIMDHGTGITKKHLSKIFDPYFTTKKKGSGLGLSTSYSIVRSHGGHITVESFPGIGTTFKIYLPASEGGKLPDCAGDARYVTGKGRILVMDDEEAVRDVTQGMLETLGYSVTLAKDGTEAIEFYRVAMASGAPFDSVLMDLTIPGGMGGMEAVKRILEIDSKAKAIVCSGYSNDTIMANYNSYGFRAVVPKPYSLKQLSGAISGVLSAPV
ncbi:MAG: PAS domain S-box protein [Candidatus Deferrimicrobium sp.]